MIVTLFNRVVAAYVLCICFVFSCSSSQNCGSLLHFLFFASCVAARVFIYPFFARQGGENKVIVTKENKPVSHWLTFSISPMIIASPINRYSLGKSTNFVKRSTGQTTSMEREIEVALQPQDLLTELRFSNFTVDGF